jgi:hypothetical protein
VSALVTRVLMRAVTLLTNGEPEFSPAALLFIASFYVLVLLPGCVALAYSRGRWPWVLFAAGVVVLAFEAVNIGLQETTHAAVMTSGRWAGLALVLLAMLAAYALQVLIAARWARHGLERHGARS